eukprot:scaffold107631_cov60-Attheya_sp.AAC.1
MMKDTRTFHCCFNGDETNIVDRRLLIWKPPNRTSGSHQTKEMPNRLLVWQPRRVAGAKRKKICPPSLALDSTWSCVPAVVLFIKTIIILFCKWPGIGSWLPVIVAFLPLDYVGCFRWHKCINIGSYTLEYHVSRSNAVPPNPIQIKSSEMKFFASSHNQKQIANNDSNRQGERWYDTVVYMMITILSWDT